MREGSREVVCPTSCGESKGDVSVKPPGLARTTGSTGLGAEGL